MTNPNLDKKNNLDEAILSAYENHIGIYRFSLLFFVVLFPVLGILVNRFAPSFFDPISYRLIISALFLALWAGSHLFKFVIKNFFLLLNTLLAIVIVWGAFIAFRNNFIFSATLIYLVIVSTASLALRKPLYVTIYGVFTTLLTSVFLYFTPIPLVDRIIIVVALIIYNFLTYIIVKSKNVTIHGALITDEKFRLLVQNIDEGIMVLNDNFEIVFTNTYSENVFGQKANLIIGKSFFNLTNMPEIESEKAKEIKDKIQANSDFELPIKTSDHTLKTLYFSRSTAINSIIGIPEKMFTFKDITQKQLEKEELERAKSKAEESDRLKTAFLANMSHEIRTPMNSILGFAQLLNTSSVNEAERKEYTEIIEKSGKRMLGILNDLINISKIESGQMSTTLSLTNLNEQLTFVFNFFQLQAKEKNLELKVQLCPSAKNKILLTDGEKFYAILINLVKNAIKFTNRGTITFGYSESEPDCVFYVKDTGIGIPASKIDTIFERFVQIDSSYSSGYEGAGLGLSITKAYVELLGGRIWIESVEGEGSTFFFSLPNSIIDSKHTTTTIAQHEPLKITEKSKILIAEDDATSMLLLNSLLSSHNLQIFKATNGKEAIDVFRKNPGIDLILMDIKMPVLDGFEAAKQLKQSNPEIKIIAQSAFALTHEKEQFGSIFDDYLTKPIEIDIFNKLINQYLNVSKKLSV